MESITDQAGRDIELLIVDDGSSDETFELCRQQARKVRRGAAVRCLRTGHRGVSGARNCGIAAASGEWILFVDADDRLAPGAIETVKRKLAQLHLSCTQLLDAEPSGRKRKEMPLELCMEGERRGPLMAHPAVPAEGKRESVQPEDRKGPESLQAGTGESPEDAGCRSRDHGESPADAGCRILREQADLICWNASRVSGDQVAPMRAFPMREQMYGKGDIRQLIEGLYNGDPALGEYYRAVWGKVFRTRIIRENHVRFPEGTVMGEDAVFLTRYLAGCERVLFVEEHWYLYTVGTGADRRRCDPEYPRMQRQEYRALQQALGDIAPHVDLDTRYLCSLFWQRARREYRSALLRSGRPAAEVIRQYRAYCRQLPTVHCLCAIRPPAGG